MREIRVGVIGLGRSGSQHLTAWNRAAGSRVVAVCDQRRDLVAAHLRPGVEPYSDAEALLERGDVDAVSICIPTAARAVAAETALRRRIHVLSEAPCAAGSAHAVRLVNTAAAHGVQLQPALPFRYLAEVRLARDLILEGDIGVPLRFEVDLCRQQRMAHHWKAVAAAAGGGVLMDQGTAAFDLIRYLLGSLQSIEVQAIEDRQGLEVEDQAMAVVQAGAAVEGQVRLSWSAPPASDFFLIVHGSGGTIALGWKASFIHRQGEEPVHIFNECSLATAYRAMTTELLELACGSGTAAMSAGDILAASAAVEAAYGALSSGRPAPVEMPEPAHLKA